MRGQQQKNWARTGVIIGIVLALMGFLLSITSEVTQDGPVIVSYIAGGAEYIIFVVTVPIVYLAGKSARKDSEVYGDEGLRVASWCVYGLGIAYALLFFQWGIIAGGDNRVPTGQITINGALLLISSMLMIADTYKSHKQALRLGHRT
jgi:hypothetical protein